MQNVRLSCCVSKISVVQSSVNDEFEIWHTFHIWFFGKLIVSLSFGRFV